MELFERLLANAQKLRERAASLRAAARALLSHANATASAFSWFRADLAALFFGPFADTVVQRVPHPALKGAQRWAAAAAFVRECCLFNSANRGFLLRAVLERPAVLDFDDDEDEDEDE
mgnify:CR=1 FL=1